MTPKQEINVKIKAQRAAVKDARATARKAASAANKADKVLIGLINARDKL